MSGRWIITGATGHIGNTLARQLIGRGERVVLLVRNPDEESIAGLAAEFAVGSFCDPEFLTGVIRQGDTVVHCAGVIQITNDHPEKIFAVNWEGTKTLADFCVNAKVRRFVYLSSVDAIYKPDDSQPITEPTAFYPDRLKSCYGQSKALATEYIRALSASGKLSAAIVYPTAVLGPNDYKVSNVGQVISDFITGKPLAWVKGQYNFVDVRDVAAGIVAAAEADSAGESYLLGGEIVSVHRLFEILSRYHDRPVPPKLPLWFVLMFSDLTVVYYKVRKKKPVFSSYALRTLNSDCNYDISKAKAELGYTPRPAETTIADTVAWFSARQKSES